MEYIDIINKAKSKEDEEKKREELDKMLRKYAENRETEEEIKDMLIEGVDRSLK
jgi:hypothetical protein